jgi:two-component system, response regulator YesN
MYKLLVVDDEDWIRERLRYTIDWSKMGIEVIGEAKDGEEALELTEKLAPDIVLTDIRMPGIDGLEYIKRLRDGNNKARAIIISGYSDFEYARKAIKLGAFDYILKPVEDDDLTGVVRRCLEEIDSDKSRDILLEKAKSQLKESLPLLRKELLTNLVNGFFSDEDKILSEFAYVGIKYKGNNKICFIVEPDGFMSQSGEHAWDGHLLQFVVANIAQDFLNKLGSGESFFLQTGEIVCIVFSMAEENVLTRQVLSISNGIRKMTRKITGYSVTIGVGRCCKTLTGIAGSYSEAREALQYKAYLGKDRIYDIRGIDTQHRPGYYKLNDLELLLNNIKMGNKANSLSVLDNIFKEIYSNNKGICPIDLKLLYMDIINSVFKTVLDANASFDDFPEFSYRFFEQLNRLQTVDEFHEWMADTIVKIIDSLGKYKGTKKRKVIEKAVEYINSHYTESITLNSVADKFYLNASYFCKIFKEEMGESFTKYFINLRVQKAKELMSDPTRKIYEIAGMVGYDDVQYFTKIFKSILGVTPMQYREKIK